LPTPAVAAIEFDRTGGTIKLSNPVSMNINVNTRAC
jgi:hypothetical protein